MNDDLLVLEHASHLAELPPAERAALIVIDRDSQICERFVADLEDALASGALAGLTVDIVRLGTPDAAAVICDGDWLDDAAGFPYIALYRRGLRVESFPAFKVAALLARLERLAFLPVPGQQPLEAPHQAQLSAIAA